MTATREGATVRAAIALFDEVDLLDVGGPYEVLLTASRLAVRAGQAPPFDVTTVGRGPVRAYGGLGLVPDRTFQDAGAIDLLIVPGAIDIGAVQADGALMQALRAAAAGASTVASVCTGAFLLAELGLLPARWTTHWEDVADLERLAGSGGARTVRWVDEGRVVTSAGLTSGIAMALHLVDRFAGTDLARRTAAQIEYAWSPDPDREAEPA